MLLKQRSNLNGLICYLVDRCIEVLNIILYHPNVQCSTPTSGPDTPGNTTRPCLPYLVF